MRNLFKFQLEKGPGYGISQNFYLVVLSPNPVLPAARQVVNGKAEGGAIPGVIAPLTESGPPQILNEPLHPGLYAISSIDRKTLIELRVQAMADSPFDPVVLAESDLGRGLDPEVLNRIRASWTISQLRVKTFDPQVHPSMLMTLGVAARLGQLAGGVIGDPMSLRYLLPENVLTLNPAAAGTKRSSKRELPYSIETVVSVHSELSRTSTQVLQQIVAYGLERFDLPPIGFTELPVECLPMAKSVLLSLCRDVLISGEKALLGNLGSEQFPLVTQLAIWKSRRTGELVLAPPDGAGYTTEVGLRAWATLVS